VLTSLSAGACLPPLPQLLDLARTRSIFLALVELSKQREGLGLTSNDSLIHQIQFKAF
jgi:hypothetical protein